MNQCHWFTKKSNQKKEHQCPAASYPGCDYCLRHQALVNRLQKRARRLELLAEAIRNGKFDA